MIEQSVRELNDQRARTGEAVEVDKEPVPIHYKDDKPKKLRQVAADHSDYHRKQDPEFQHMVKIGADPEKLLAMAKDPEEVRRLTGWTAAEAKEYARTGAMPPQKIGLVKETTRGRELRDPLLEHYSAADTLDEPLSPRQAAREIGNFRQELAAQQEALRQEVEGAEARVEQQREQARVESEQRAAQEQYDRQQAEAQRQQALQQRQADDAERIRVAQLEWQQQAGAEEKQWLDADQKWNAWAAQIPEMMSHEALAHTQKTNPQRWAQLQQEIARYQAFLKSGRARLAEIGETKQLREHAIATRQTQAMQAAYRQYAESEDGKAHDLIAREIPAYKTEEGRRAIKQASRTMLKNLGLTDQHIKQVWADGAPINLRSAPAQAIMAKAAAYDLAVARARDVQNNRAPLPQVQKPGVYRPRGAGDAETVLSLQRQLDNSSGNAALKIATKLQQAKRAAGRL
jgi:hypothetical protein